MPACPVARSLCVLTDATPPRHPPEETTMNAPFRPRRAPAAVLALATTGTLLAALLGTFERAVPPLMLAATPALLAQVERCQTLAAHTAREACAQRVVADRTAELTGRGPARVAARCQWTPRQYGAASHRSPMPRPPPRHRMPRAPRRRCTRGGNAPCAEPSTPPRSFRASPISPCRRS
jgi:hypothetical protein